MANIEHKNIPDNQRHEPKGISTAPAGQVYVSNGSGGGTWQPIPEDKDMGCLQGVYDYADLGTHTTPIELTTGGVQYELTNDAQGTTTNVSYPLTGVPSMWNPATDRLVFTEGGVLALGDTVDVRVDVEVSTSSANTVINILLELGIGGSPYQIPIIASLPVKSAGTYKLAGTTTIYLGDSNTLDNLGKFLASSDTSGTTVKVNGWFIRPLHSRN